MNLVLGGGLVVALALPAGMAAVLTMGSAMSAPAASAQALAGIPGSLLVAYKTAASDCPGLPWTVLAAIGEVETDHGRSGGARLAPDGHVAPRIRGPVLDGSSGTARVLDSDGGHIDGDSSLDRAVGPMQFLPGTWSRWGRDASGDGLADIDNAYDAIASAAAYLCGESGRVGDIPAAVARYNHTAAYVERVLSVAATYGSANNVVLPGPGID
ncbi:MAG: lytic transglycosylase domain-containing protein, partial [Acidimicrobiia bacterium]